MQDKVSGLTSPAKPGSLVPIPAKIPHGYAIGAVPTPSPFLGSCAIAWGLQRVPIALNSAWIRESGSPPRISAGMPFRDRQWPDILRQMRVRNAVAQ